MNVMTGSRFGRPEGLCFHGIRRTMMHVFPGEANAEVSVLNENLYSLSMHEPSRLQAAPHKSWALSTPPWTCPSGKIHSLIVVRGSPSSPYVANSLLPARFTGTVSSKACIGISDVPNCPSKDESSSICSPYSQDHTTEADTSSEDVCASIATEHT